MLCRHFGLCGGCTLQDQSPDDYRALKRRGVITALEKVGLGDVTVAEPVMAPLYSRRRAVFKIEKTKGVLEVGFHARGSHQVVDMCECLVLTPSLLKLAQLLRGALTPILHDGEKAEVHATDSDTGLDLSLRCERKLTPALTAVLAKAFAGQGIARVPGGGTLSLPPIARVLFNNDMVLEEATPAITLGGARVALPPQAFLQATSEGEAALQSHVLELTKGAKIIADLFAGLGTFTLALARKAKVHAVEQDATLLKALAAAARDASGLKPITTEQRDLFKLPLTALELKAFDAVVLDPPRAGAQAQCKALAASKVARIAYVSCDAASFARDAAILAGAGFRPGTVTPIDQFLYSGHIELVAGFDRGGK
jgi:23S rRNA (uracil1939-C5)-methyltransferase